jgi:PAS domain S-box-containing protein
MKNLENMLSLQKQFQAFLDIVVDPASIISDKGVFVLWNKAFADLLEVEDLTDRTYMEFTHKEDLELDSHLHQECIDLKRDHYTIRKRYVTAKGNIVFVRLTVRYVCGEISCYAIATATDITIEGESQNLAVTRARLLDAIEQQSFVLHYQPIIALKDFPLFSTQKGDVFAHEALVRWQTPSDLIYPDMFLPTLRLLGMEHNLCKLVLDMAIKRIGETGLRTCINIEPLTLSLDEFNKMLYMKLNKYGVTNLSLVILEIVESEAIDGVLAEKLSLLSKNVLISLDDWGSKYNNLVRIATLPIHLVKLDKSLLENKTIVERSIALIHELGLMAIAEGVETQEQAEWLASVRCDFAQGYFFGFPQADESR